MNKNIICAYTIYSIPDKNSKQLSLTVTMKGCPLVTPEYAFKQDNGSTLMVTLQPQAVMI